MDYVAVEGTCNFDCAQCSLIEGDKIPCVTRRILITVKSILNDCEEIKRQLLAVSPTEKTEIEVVVDNSIIEEPLLPTSIP